MQFVLKLENLQTCLRKSNNNDTVMLGEKNEYEPLSREAFVSKMKNKKLSIQNTHIEVNLKNLEHNLNFLRKKISEKTKILCVVKAFGYGSEPVEIAKVGGK